MSDSEATARILKHAAELRLRDLRGDYNSLLPKYKEIVCKLASLKKEIDEAVKNLYKAEDAVVCKLHSTEIDKGMKGYDC